MNKKALFLLIVLDLLAILLISALLSLASYLLGYPIIPSFLISLVLVIFIGLISNAVIKNKKEQSLNLIEYETARLISNTSLLVSCAYCRAENSQIINLNGDMTFNCVSCKQPNKVTLSYGAIRMTTPLNTNIDLNDKLPPEQLPADLVQSTEQTPNQTIVN